MDEAEDMACLYPLVLILILMEYSQTDSEVSILMSGRLNPYSNGILTDKEKVMFQHYNKGLNPYSNGILTDSEKRNH